MEDVEVIHAYNRRDEETSYNVNIENMHTERQGTSNGVTLNNIEMTNGNLYRL